MKMKNFLKLTILLITAIIEISSKTMPIDTKNSLKHRRSDPQSDANVTTTTTTTTAAINLPKNVTMLINDLKKLRAKKSKDEMRQITTLGLVSGAMRVERNMRENIAQLMKEFYMNFNSSTPDVNMDKLFHLETTMERDKRAIQILASVLDYAINSLTHNEYKAQLETISKDSEIALLKLSKKRFAQQLSAKNKNETIGNLVQDSQPMKLQLDKTLQSVKTSVEHHINEVHATVKRKVKETVKYLKQQNTASKKEKKHDFDEIPNKMLESTPKPTKDAFSRNQINSKRLDWMDVNINRKKRQQSAEKESADNEVASKQTSAQQTEGGESGESGSESEEQPGGLLGLIAGLSGGEEGSDIGALLGALTGVVTNLFGPGGLDIPSLLGTATGLISGLLAGDENFGKVLAGYITTSVDGLSGGGGADLNGQFFGQFLATLFAGLSADPEDDDLPPKPELFIKNIFVGSAQATNKAGMGGDGGAMDGAEDSGKEGGSDLFGFIGNIITSIVAGVTNLIVNASLGSLGGSSQGSVDASAGASGGSSASSSKWDKE